jgi:hypothetical protein
LPLPSALEDTAGEETGAAAAERGGSTGAATGLEGRERWAGLRCDWAAAAAEVDGSLLSMGITRGWALAGCCCCWLAGAVGVGLAAWLGAWQQQEGYACSACRVRKAGRHVS